MTNILPPHIVAKVKGDDDASQIVATLIDMLDEVIWRTEAGDLGVFEELIKQSRRNLTSSLDFYNRHRNPNSPMRDKARSDLKAALKGTVKRLFANINKALPHKKKLPLPCKWGLFEATCDKLFVLDAYSKFYVIEK